MDTKQPTHLNPWANFSLTWQVNRGFRNYVPTSFMKPGGSVSQRDFINAFTEKRKSRRISLNQTSENPHRGKCNGKGFSQSLYVVTAVGFNLEMQ